MKRKFRELFAQEYASSESFERRPKAMTNAGWNTKSKIEQEVQARNEKGNGA
jgi:hypothetical protein